MKILQCIDFEKFKQKPTTIFLKEDYFGNKIYAHVAVSKRIAKQQQHIEIADFIEQILQGCTWTAAFAPAERKDEFFLQSSIFAVDLDNLGSKSFEWYCKYIEEVCKESMIPNPYLIHESMSSTLDNLKLRIIWITKYPITDSTKYKQYLRSLIQLFDGDEQCKDSARLYFGAKENSKTLIHHEFFDEESLARLKISPAAAAAIGIPADVERNDTLAYIRLKEQYMPSLEKKFYQINSSRYENLKDIAVMLYSLGFKSATAKDIVCRMKVAYSDIWNGHKYNSDDVIDEIYRWIEKKN